MIRLSVVIITLNEEKNIKRCLDSVKEIADDIVVLDSNSTDKTEEICKTFNVRFYTRDFEGYVKSKNYANSLAEYPYILSLDADEALSEELKKSISKIKNNWNSDGYVMNRMTNYCGKWIKHGGWYPDRKLRLFDRRKGKWEGKLIHEKVVMDKEANTEMLKGDVLHYSYYSISEHILQANSFTDIAAQEFVEREKNAGMLKLLFSPCVKFFKDYFIRLGFLDGYYGYIICRISAHATFLKYAKIRQLAKIKKLTF
jgi:glycosyltransferase involved in cell wall biosynthesis